MAICNSGVIKMSSMLKKAQNKTPISQENYKKRLFLLYPTVLKYCIGDADKFKDKGSVLLNSVRVVNSVEDNALPGKHHVFQIVYREDGEIQLLYIVANSADERTEWIEHLRQTCRNLGVEFSAYYHPGAWTKTSRIFSCCHKEGRDAAGCRPCHTPSNKENSRRHKTDITTPKLPYNLKSSTSEDDKSEAGMPVAQVLRTQQSNRLKDGEIFIPPFSPPPPPVATNTESKIFVAIYDFSGVEKEDLSIKKNKEYEILDTSNEHWWYAKDLTTQQTGYIPSNYVKNKHTLETHEWFHKDVSRTLVDEMLKKDGRVGAFLVRDSITQPGLFTLSIFSGERDYAVRHYHIKQNDAKQYYVAENRTFHSVTELIHYHSMNAAGIATRTRFPVRKSRFQPPTAGFGHDKWEIDRSELETTDLLGAGHFGSVYKALWKKELYVAVKTMIEGTMSEENFIDEAKTMKMLRHRHLVQLYGVVTKKRPIWIVTEYMPHGSLHSYVRRHSKTILPKTGKLLDMATQVCKGMTYLERKKFIHRDLATRNCLVGHDNIVKVADFGLTRYVIDDEYQSSSGAKFPIKWAPPEVLSYIKFSSKSDMWAFGVLLWELYTGGEMPYGSMPNPDVVNHVVNRKKRLTRPPYCPQSIYDIMLLCWHQEPDPRPSFKEMEMKLVKMCDSGDYT